MKVRVSYTVKVSDDMRWAMREFYGEEGLATRTEIQRWYEKFGHSMDDDLGIEMDRVAMCDELSGTQAVTDPTEVDIT